MAKKSDTESEWLFYLILALLVVSLFVNAVLLSKAPTRCPAEKACDCCGGKCAQGQSCLDNGSMSYSCLTVCDIGYADSRCSGNCGEGEECAPIGNSPCYECKATSPQCIGFGMYDGNGCGGNCDSRQTCELCPKCGCYRCVPPLQFFS